MLHDVAFLICGGVPSFGDCLSDFSIKYVTYVVRAIMPYVLMLLCYNTDFDHQLNTVPHACEECPSPS